MSIVKVNLLFFVFLLFAIHNIEIYIFIYV